MRERIAKHLFSQSKRTVRSRADPNIFIPACSGATAGGPPAASRRARARWEANIFESALDRTVRLEENNKYFVIFHARDSCRNVQTFKLSEIFKLSNFRVFQTFKLSKFEILSNFSFQTSGCLKNVLGKSLKI